MHWWVAYLPSGVGGAGKPTSMYGVATKEEVSSPFGTAERKSAVAYQYWADIHQYWGDSEPI